MTTYDSIGCVARADVQCKEMVAIAAVARELEKENRVFLRIFPTFLKPRAHHQMNVHGHNHTQI